jgi:AcrR family transcriptional regulator
MTAGVMAPEREGASVETEKRRQILEGARKVFLSAGFDGASMSEIARAAGVSKGTLYVYFDSKDALFEALTIDQKRGLAEALFSLDPDDPDTRGVLTRLGHIYLREVGKPDHVSLVRMVIGACEKFPHLGQSFFEAGPALGVARLSAYFEAQVAAGRLRKADTDLAAKHFLHLCQAGHFTGLLFAAGGELSESDMHRRVDEAVRVFMAGYGPE